MSVFHFLQEVEVQNINDLRGNLDVIELSADEIFEPKRFYYISGVPKGHSRGQHAHKSLKQCFFALAGSYVLKVTDGFSTDLVEIKEHSQGYYLTNGLWRELTNFSTDAVCLVLASEHYDENDYIYSMEEYLDWKNQK